LIAGGNDAVLIQESVLTILEHEFVAEGTEVIDGTFVIGDGSSLATGVGGVIIVGGSYVL
jgi:hypothetical protein